MRERLGKVESHLNYYQYFDDVDSEQEEEAGVTSPNSPKSTGRSSNEDVKLQNLLKDLVNKP
jgi:hypothetical protein